MQSRVDEDIENRASMNSEISIQFLSILFLVIAVFRASAQDSGYLPDLPGFPSGTYAQVAAVGAKIHGSLDVTESDPVTGHVKRRHRMVYFPPTEVYWTRMGTTYEYTDPAIVARYSNPSLKGGRDVVSQRTTVKYYQRDGGVVGYTVVAFAGGAVDRILEFEPYAVDVGMPSPGFVGRPLENLTPGYMAEIEFRPKVTVFSVPTEESRTPDYTMFGMLQRLRKAAGEYGALITPNLVRNAAATDAFVEDLRGLYKLGEMACTPMRAKNSPLFSNEALVREISSAIANWETTMAGIQQQMESSAYAYWDSLSGRTDPWDAYRMEGVAGYHIASFFVPGWKVAGSGKLMAGTAKCKNVAELVNEVSLVARIARSGMTPRQAKELFGWGSQEITKPLSSFSRESLEAAGWTKDKLLDVAQGYRELAGATPNPSAPLRAAQLESLAKLFK